MNQEELEIDMPESNEQNIIEEEIPSYMRLDCKELSIGIGHALILVTKYNDIIESIKPSTSSLNGFTLNMVMPFFFANIQDMGKDG